ncbi:MAG: hypothetical protein IPF52_14410 [Saprospiraceae bacterium]|nr:hypothetical protein [Saprospiraceae bacterium]
MLLNTKCLSISCNNNTRTITTDDFYTINWTLVNNKTNVGTYRFWKTMLNWVFIHMEHLSRLPENALGQIITLVFEDVATGCRNNRFDQSTDSLSDRLRNCSKSNN